VIKIGRDACFLVFGIFLLKYEARVRAFPFEKEVGHNRQKCRIFNFRLIPYPYRGAFAGSSAPYRLHLTPYPIHYLYLIAYLLYILSLYTYLVEEIGEGQSREIPR
jgi:hypothetical protein